MPELDFRKTKKQYLTIHLNDEKQTKLSVMQPTKHLFDLMISMSEQVEAIQSNDLQALEHIYEVCAQLISRNKEGIIFGRSELEKVLDFEDLVIFLQTYSSFVDKIVTEKN